jgi:copper chaperone
MKKYQFKTTINCSGCVAKVTPHLNANTDIKNWEVDINNPEKTLTVEAETLEQNEVQALVEKLGFKAEPKP